MYTLMGEIDHAGDRLHALSRQWNLVHSVYCLVFSISTAATIFDKTAIYAYKRILCYGGTASIPQRQ
jgi:hypothetical protein